MGQLALTGRTKEAEEKISKIKKDLKFYRKTKKRLSKIRNLIKNRENGTVIQSYADFEESVIGISFDEDGNIQFGDDFQRRTLLGEWWYINKIEGWNNDIPVDSSDFSYEDVPQNELDSGQYRSSLISEGKKVVFDREFALERLETAIEGYEKKIEEGEKELEELEGEIGWEG